MVQGQEAPELMEGLREREKGRQTDKERETGRTRGRWTETMLRENAWHLGINAGIGLRKRRGLLGYRNHSI